MVSRSTRNRIARLVGLAYLILVAMGATWFIRRQPVSDGTTEALVRASSTESPVGEMVLIPAGPFWMGSARETVRAEGTSADTVNEYPDNAYPKHRVYLDAFLISKHEITNAQYKRFIDAGGYENRAFWSREGWDYIQRRNITEPSLWNDANLGIAKPDRPVVGVSWYEADAFAKWVGMRLPTEAEWEKAARGTDERMWPWGNDWSPELEDQGMVPPNGGASPYGVYGMAGGAWEWVWDWFDADYYRTEPPGGWKNPRGPKSGSHWVIRGGTFDFEKQYQTRTTKRATYLGADSCFVGFRIADDVGPQNQLASEQAEPAQG